MPNKPATLRFSFQAKGGLFTLVSNIVDKERLLARSVYDTERSGARRWRAALSSVFLLHFCLIGLCFYLASSVLHTLPPELKTLVIEFTRPEPIPVKPVERVPTVAESRKPLKSMSPVESPKPPRVLNNRPSTASAVPLQMDKNSVASSSPLAASPLSSQAVVPTPTAEVAPSSVPAVPSSSSSSTASVARDERPEVQKTSEPKEESTADDGAWHGAVTERLHRYKRYPAEALELRQEGTVHVRFRLNRRGKILALTVEKSSGIESLDQEAIALVRRAQPLPPPPLAVKGDSIELTVPLEFYLRQK